MDYLKIYRDCYMIRMFEKMVEKYFELGKMRGTTHGCIGQEIIPVIVMENIDKEVDYITGTHRCHGQVLSYTQDTYRLACEMMGKCDGFNCGMGGSQHIKTQHFITNGITGGMAAVGTGMALAIKKNHQKGLVISFLGDGGFQEGYVAETMSMASVMEVPIVYVIENNHYAMSTPTEKYAAGTFESRSKALDIAYYHTTAAKIDHLAQTVSSAVAYTRDIRRPACIDIDTFRLCGHSKSDDMAYMTKEERENNSKNDPLIQLEMLINDRTALSEMKKEVQTMVEKAFRDADKCHPITYSEYRKIIFG